MTCPYCNVKETPTKVTDSRMTGSRKRRRRECQFCGNKFTTYESIDFYPYRNSGTVNIPKKKKPGPKARSKKVRTTESNWLQRVMAKLDNENSVSSTTVPHKSAV
jgi:transcriptional regulator NrdR family protein